MSRRSQSDDREGGVKRDIMLAAKRVVDLAIGSVLLLLTLPAMIAVAAAVKLSSPGPVFFRQQREGHRGTLFRIFKFRSMVRDAEDHGPVLSIADPRITRIGRFLRRTSLDELPQLLNVVFGEMSLVGPRPLLPGTTLPAEIGRLDMRPGMTSLSVVNKPYLLSWDERMQLDLRYVEEWSLWLDLRILIRTLLAVFTKQNILYHPRVSTPSPEEKATGRPKSDETDREASVAPIRKNTSEGQLDSTVRGDHQ